MGTTRTSAVITLTITPDNSAPVWDGTLLYTIPRAEEWTLDLDTLVTGEPEPDITFDGSNFPSGWTWSFDAATHMLRVTPTTTGGFEADATASNSSGSADATLEITVEANEDDKFLIDGSSDRITDGDGDLLFAFE